MLPTQQKIHSDTPLPTLLTTGLVTIKSQGELLYHCCVLIKYYCSLSGSTS